MIFILDDVFKLAHLMHHSAALSYATQHAMPLELGGKWGLECLNTRFPVPTLLLCGIQRQADFIFICLWKLG